MKRGFVLLLIILCCVSVLLGCSDRRGDIPGIEKDPPSSAVNATGDGDPALPVNGLETAALEVVPIHAGRANATSGNMLWETDAGYYFAWCQILYYADKSNLHTWVPVCSQPDCKHNTVGGLCDAITFSEIVLENDRIFYNTTSQDTAALSNSGLHGEFIASMAPDGTDKRLEYHIPEVQENSNSQEQASRSILTSEFFLYNLSSLNPNGQYDTYVYLADDQGVITLASGTQEENQLGSCLLRHSGIYGDEGFRSNLIDGNYNVAYRIRDRELVATDLDGLMQSGAHLSGDTLWVFRTNDGYYSVDLNTREEQKLSETQLQNSYAHIMLPNCILESTLLGNESVALRNGAEEHALRFFNGEEWKDVLLPEEIARTSDEIVFLPQAVTSDRIILVCRDAADTGFSGMTYLYQIILTADTPTLEYLGTIG